MLLGAVPGAACAEELADIRVRVELRFGRLPAKLREAVARRRGALEGRPRA